MTLPTAERRPRARTIIAWCLVAASLAAALVGLFAAGTTAGMLSTGLMLAFALIFTFVHGSAVVGWPRIVAFAALGYLIAFSLEASSVAFGFPFGFYEHLLAGPRLLDVPLATPLVYVAYGWTAWTLACLIVRGRETGALRTVDRFAVPAVAAFILTGWDLVFDVIYSGIQNQYVYTNPGGFFGVPVTNYLGWLFTGWLLFQIFALIPQRGPRQPSERFDTSLALSPVALWPLAGIPLIGSALTTDPAQTISIGERVFFVADIYGASLVMAIMCLLFTAVIAGVRVMRPQYGG